MNLAVEAGRIVPSRDPLHVGAADHARSDDELARQHQGPGGGFDVEEAAQVGQATTRGTTRQTDLARRVTDGRARQQVQHERADITVEPGCRGRDGRCVGARRRAGADGRDRLQAGSGADAETSALHRTVDGPWREPETARDLGRGAALGDEVEDLPLSGWDRTAEERRRSGGDLPLGTCWTGVPSSAARFARLRPIRPLLR